MPPRRGLRFDEWSYVNLTIAAFVFAPELRRLVDWHGNFDPLNALSILPLVMLIPIGAFTYKRRRAIVGLPFATVALLWCFAFAYAFVVGVAQRTILPGLYDVGLFVLPLVVGAWLVASPESMATMFRRLSGALLAYGGIAAAYGIVQYVVAPPWDTAWMIDVGSTAFGTPGTFSIRVFSVLNSPGTYAEFTAFSLIFNLPNIRLGRPWTMLAAILMMAALVLTLVRLAWIAVVFGALVYAVLSPRRVKALISLASIGVLFAGAGLAFFAVVPSDDVRMQLSDRFATLSDIPNDGSAVARQQTSSVALASGLANPLGHGLGLTGQAATLANPDLLTRSDLPDSAIDNGYLARFVEMGYPGLALFLAASLYAAFVTFAHLRRYRASGDVEAATVVAASLAVQLMFFLVSISGDVYAGIGALFFSIAAGIALMRNAPAPAAVLRVALRSNVRYV